MYRIMRLARRAFFAAATYPLLIFSALRRRNPACWVFGAWFGRRYTDSPRYVFEYVREHCPDIRAVWLSRDPAVIAQVRAAGGEAYGLNTWAGFWVAAGAGLTVVNCSKDDVNAAASLRSKKLQLWHGTPLKKILHDDTVHFASPWARAARAIANVLLPQYRQDWDLIVSPSDHVRSRLASAFAVSPSRVAITGSPRVDVILETPPTPVAAVTRIRSAFPGVRLVGYLPTHRGEGHGRTGYFDTFDVEQVTRTLEHLNAALVIKLHYYHLGTFTELALDTVARSGRICWLTEESVPDVNHLLAHLDVLVTDYSSAYFDFLVTRRPTLFLAYDEETYLRDDRAFYEDLRDIATGPVVRSWGELMDLLSETLRGGDRYADRRDAQARRFNTYEDCLNVRRVVNVARGLMNLADSQL